MQNFNTNQTRHLYVAGAIDANVDTNLDIALGTTATGEMYFKYKNADGFVTRSDTFDPKKIVSLKLAPAASLAKKLLMAVVSADTAVIDFGATSSFIGKTINLMVTIHGVFDYDDDNSTTVLASIVGDATNLASQAAFTKYMAIALAKNLVNKADPSYPLLKVFYGTTEVTKNTTVASLTGTGTSFKIVQNPQKWVRGKLTGEPVNFSVYGKAYKSNIDDINWVTESSTKLVASDVTGYLTISGDYKIADLEYFALGERGDMIRGYNFPNNYETTYAVVPGTNYSMLSIEYYWQGAAENIVKSPRLIEIVAPYNSTAASDICTQLYNAINAATADGAADALEARVKALEDAS